MYKPGDLVRHRSKPEWGLGRVTGQTGEGKVLVKFASRTGDVLLTAEGAAAHLVPDTGTPVSFTASSPGRAPAPLRRTPCVACAKDLQEVLMAPDGAWRSCPHCSSRDGRQHVYRPFPDAFDPAEAGPPAEAPDDDPRHHWCRDCRAGKRVQEFRLCRDVR